MAADHHDELGRRRRSTGHAPTLALARGTNLSPMRERKGPAVPATTSEPRGPREPRPGPPRRSAARRLGWGLVPVAVVLALLLGELGARLIGPEIPRRAGSEERAFVKADQMHARGRGSTDVLIIGSSETAGGLIPSVVAEQAPMLDGIYNGALAGSYQPVQQEWAERVAVPALDPPVVVIGLLPMAVWDLTDKFPDPNGDAQDTYRAAFDQLDPGHLGQLGWALRENSALIRYRPYLRRPTLVLQGLGNLVGVLDDTPPKRELSPFGMDWKTETDPQVVRENTAETGEVFDYHSRSLPVTVDRTNKKIFDRIATGTIDFEPLESLVDSLRDQGTTPLLALGPIDRSVLVASGVDLAPYDDLVTEIKAWADERDLPVNDAFSATWSPDDFHDRTHLDLAGSKRWSAQVGTWLAELCRAGTLPDACAPTP